MFSYRTISSVKEVLTVTSSDHVTAVIITSNKQKRKCWSYCLVFSESNSVLETLQCAKSISWNVSKNEYITCSGNAFTLQWSLRWTWKLLYSSHSKTRVWRV